MHANAASPAPSRLAIAFALAVVYLVWGSTYLAIAIGLEGFDPFLMAGSRFLAAGAMLYAMLRWRGLAARRGRSGRTPRSWACC